MSSSPAAAANWELTSGGLGAALGGIRGFWGHSGDSGAIQGIQGPFRAAEALVSVAVAPA